MLEIPAAGLAVAGLAVLVTGCPTSTRQDTKSPFENATETPREGTRPTKIAGKTFHPIGPVPSPGGFQTGSKPLRKGMRGSLEILGGVLFGAALLVKLLPAMLLPIAAIIIWTKNRQGVSPNEENKTQGKQSLQQIPIHKGPLGSHWNRIARLSLKQLLLFGITMSLTFVALDLIIERGAFLAHFQQSWISHFGTPTSTEYGSAEDHPFDWSVLLKNWDATLPALIGIFVAWRQFRKNAALAIPLGWMVLSLFVFTIHKPWWQYYYIHIAIPLCWCAGLGIVAMFNLLRPSHSALHTTESRHYRRNRAVLTVSLLFAFCASLWMASRAYVQIKTMRDSPELHAALILREIERFKPFTHWFFTEEPIYSFHAGIPMPPQLAVIHLKRLWAGEMTQARLASELTLTKPELILLVNNGKEVPFQNFLDAEYRSVYIDTDHRLFAHQTISRKGFR